MKTSQLVSLSCLVLCLIATAVAAPPAGKGKEPKGGPKGPDKGPASVETKKTEPPKTEAGAKVSVTITPQEREVIQGYIQTYTTSEKGKKAGGLPPGLAKKVARGKRLPPGWEKKLAKGEVMPVEIVAEAQPLPREIVVKLPPPPKGIITVVIEGKVVRLLEATREILDVFDVGK